MKEEHELLQYLPDLTDDYFTGGENDDEENLPQLNMKILESTLALLDQELETSSFCRDSESPLLTKSLDIEISPSSPPTPPPSPRGRYIFESDTRGGTLLNVNDVVINENNTQGPTVEENLDHEDSKYIFQKLITMKKGPLSTPYHSSNNVQKVDSYILSLLR